MVEGQDVTVNCNYSTPYPIPEMSPTEYYLYDGIGLTIRTFYELTSGVPLRVQITETTAHSNTPLFNGFFDTGTTPNCQNTWINRCTHSFDQDASCNPCDYSVTLSSYNSSIDQTTYVCIVTATSSESSLVALTGKN